MNSIKLSEKHKKMSESGECGEKSMKKDRGGSFPTLSEYNYALQIINDYPYEVVKKGVRDIDAEGAAKLFQKKIDELG